MSNEMIEKVFAYDGYKMVWLERKDGLPSFTGLPTIYFKGTLLENPKEIFDAMGYLFDVMEERGDV